jgi:hypothetical protein
MSYSHVHSLPQVADQSRRNTAMNAIQIVA